MELRDYFYDYILTPVSVLIYNRTIYKDFQNACLSNGFYRDSFTDFVDTIYYKAMITDICKLLESPKQSDDRNFRGFIKLFRSKESEIFNVRSGINVVNLDTGNIECVDISSKVKHDFNRIRHDKILNELEQLFEIFRKYRNKTNCHQTSQKIEPPSRDDVDRAILILYELLHMYANLFGIYIISNLLKPEYKNSPMRGRV